MQVKPSPSDFSPLFSSAPRLAASLNRAHPVETSLRVSLVEHRLFPVLEAMVVARPEASAADVEVVERESHAHMVDG